MKGGCRRTPWVAIVALVGCAPVSPLPSVDAGGPCDHELDLELVTSSRYFEAFVHSRTCTRAYGTDGGCVQRSAGDSNYCECPARASSPPELTDLRLIVGGVAHPFDLSRVCGDSRAFLRRPEGSFEEATLEVSGCWGAAEVSDVITAPLPAPTCDRSPDVGIQCVLDESADVGHVCRDWDVAGTTCCEAAGPVIEVEDPTEARLPSIHVGAARLDAIFEAEGIRIRFWRDATFWGVADAFPAPDAGP